MNIPMLAPSEHDPHASRNVHPEVAELVVIRRGEIAGAVGRIRTIAENAGFLEAGAVQNSFVPQSQEVASYAAKQQDHAELSAEMPQNPLVPKSQETQRLAAVQKSAEAQPEVPALDIRMIQQQVAAAHDAADVPADDWQHWEEELRGGTSV